MRDVVQRAPIFVLFDGILKVAEGNVGHVRRLVHPVEQVQRRARSRAAGATAAQASTWAFDAVTRGTSSLRAVGTLPAAVAGENPFVPGNFVYSPSQNETNQIETADKAYMAKTSGGSTPGGGGGGSTGGGC